MIENNEDNAQLHVEENRSALCFNDWKDYRIAAEIVSYMQGYNDPRLEKYFTQGKYQDDTDYYGLRIGILPSKVTDDELIQTYSNRLMTANDTYMWMTAAEVTFLRAEGALRGWAMSGDAQQLYEKAITLSFEQWGASGASGYSQNKTLVPGAYKDPRGTYSAQSRAASPLPGTRTRRIPVSKKTWNVSLLKNGLPCFLWALKPGANIAAQGILNSFR